MSQNNFLSFYSESCHLSENLAGFLTLCTKTRLEIFAGFLTHCTETRLEFFARFLTHRTEPRLENFAPVKQV